MWQRADDVASQLKLRLAHPAAELLDRMGQALAENSFGRQVVRYVPDFLDGGLNELAQVQVRRRETVAGSVDLQLRSRQDACHAVMELAGGSRPFPLFPFKLGFEQLVFLAGVCCFLLLAADKATEYKHQHPYNRQREREDNPFVLAVELCLLFADGQCLFNQ